MTERDWVDEEMVVRDDRQPNIGHLADAFEIGPEGRPMPRFQAGEKIVLERRMTLLPGKPWLSTNTYVVEHIDQETGLMRLWNEEVQQFDLTNYVTGIKKHGFVYKLLGGRRRTLEEIQEGVRIPDPLPVISGVRKRGRPRKNPLPPQ
jgi:hypothetical protein